MNQQSHNQERIHYFHNGRFILNEFRENSLIDNGGKSEGGIKRPQLLRLKSENGLEKSVSKVCIALVTRALLIMILPSILLCCLALMTSFTIYFFVTELVSLETHRKSKIALSHALVVSQSETREGWIIQASLLPPLILNPFSSLVHPRDSSLLPITNPNSLTSFKYHFQPRPHFKKRNLFLYIMKLTIL